MKNIVLITGGCGCLGQHIVKEFQESRDFDEIRVFDLNPYIKRLDYISKTPVTSIVGDVCDLETVCTALSGVSTVIHSAAVVSVSMFPDMKKMFDVNVKGTSNIIKGCILQNVQYLIYTSTIDVVVGPNDIINGKETLARPKKLLYEGYGGTKFEAETLVIAANDQPLLKGQSLQTLSLRLAVLYGENDEIFIPSILKSAKKSSGILFRVGDSSAIMQQMYAGNAAWAHLCATRTLTQGNAAGKVFFINDDTPMQDGFNSAKPFLDSYGYKLSKFYIPYKLIYGVLFVLQWVLTVVRLMFKVNLEISANTINYIHLKVYFSRQLAEKDLKYQPKYDYNESLEKSIKYYTNQKF